MPSCTCEQLLLLLLSSIRLAVFGSLYLRDTARPSVLQLAAITGRLYRSNAKFAERINSVILYDDVMVTTFVMGRNAMKIMWKREVTRPVQMMLSRVVIAAMKRSDSRFQWKGQDEVELGKKFYTHSTQMAKYCEKITRGN